MEVKNCPAYGKNTGCCYAPPYFGQCKNTLHCRIKDIIRICHYQKDNMISNAILNLLKIEN